MASGFSAITQRSESFDNLMREFRRDGMAVRVIRERGKWSLEVGFPTTTPWYDVGIWAAYLVDAKASFDLPSFGAQADFLKGHLVEIESAARADREVAAHLSTVAWDRAKRRFGLPDDTVRPGRDPDL